MALAPHKFRVGQVVDFNPSPRIGVPPSVRDYKVLKLLPNDGAGEHQYRIKTIAEAFERVAKESELAAA
jgi:hypothetical protein